MAKECVTVVEIGSSKISAVVAQGGSTAFSTLKPEPRLNMQDSLKGSLLKELFLKMKSRVCSAKFLQFTKKILTKFMSVFLLNFQR